MIAKIRGLKLIGPSFLTLAWARLSKRDGLWRFQCDLAPHHRTPYRTADEALRAAAKLLGITVRDDFHETPSEVVKRMYHYRCNNLADLLEVHRHWKAIDRSVG